jgi:hypothetical protein
VEGEYHRVALTPQAGVDLRSLVFDVAQEHQWRLRELTRSRHTLEDIFVHLTRGKKEEP